MRFLLGFNALLYFSNAVLWATVVQQPAIACRVQTAVLIPPTLAPFSIKPVFSPENCAFGDQMH